MSSKLLSLTPKSFPLVPGPLQLDPKPLSLGTPVRFGQFQATDTCFQAIFHRSQTIFADSQTTFAHSTATVGPVPIRAVHAFHAKYAGRPANMIPKVIPVFTGSVHKALITIPTDASKKSSGTTGYPQVL